MKTTTYVITTRDDPNGCKKVDEAQIKKLNALGRSYKVLEWPTWVTDNNIARTKDKFDFSSLDSPAIYLNGHGRFHNRTHFFVDGIKEDVDYFQLDQHGDLSFPNDRDDAEYQSHAFKTHELEHVKHMFMLGLNPFGLMDELGRFAESEDSEFFEFDPSPALFNPKVDLYIGQPWEELRMQHLEADSVFSDPVEAIERLEKYGHKYLHYMEFDPASSPTPNAYVSVDLDVIKDFPTGWPMGGLWTTNRVIDSIRQIGKVKRIVGADICGLKIAGASATDRQEEIERSALVDIIRIHDALAAQMEASRIWGENRK